MALKTRKLIAMHQEASASKQCPAKLRFAEKHSHRVLNVIANEKEKLYKYRLPRAHTGSSSCAANERWTLVSRPKDLRTLT